MQIGILGLLPEQANAVQEEFPDHALRFLSKDHQSNAGTFAKGCDKVVLMTRFIGHDMMDHVPMKKRVFCNGSVSSLKSQLLKLPTVPKVTQMAPKPAPVTSSTAHKNPGKMTLPADELVDWTPMDVAKMGEEVRIKRPAKVTIKLFDGRITAGRSYRKAKWGIETTPHKIVDGYAVFKIKDTRAAMAKKLGHPDPVAASATPVPDATPPVNQQEAAPVEIYADNQRALSTAPALQARESAFWQSAFIETMRQWPGAPVETIAARADECLRAYTSRAAVGKGERH